MQPKSLSLLLAFMSAIPVFSQDWIPVGSGRKYHFRIDTAEHITNTIYVDSVTLNGADSIFHLNRIMVVCDTCGDPWDLYTWKNQPQFLQQRMVRKPGGLYRFEDKNIFYLKPLENKGASWIFDSVGAVTAVVDDVYLGNVIGTTDSVKRILLTTGDTILLSKNHGITMFPSAAGYYYLLEGIGGTDLGIQIPEFHEFFNFEVGDVFQYLWETYYLGDGSHVLTKSTILEKTDYGDSLVYGVHNMGFSWQTAYPGYPHDTSYFDVFTQWKFIDSAGHFCNRFYKEATISVPPFWGPVFCEVDLVWESDSMVSKKIRSNPYIGQGLGWQLMNPSNPMYHPDLLIPAVDGYELEYRPGLGKVYYYFWIFEVNEWEELIGYVKDGDTTGKVYEDSLLTVVRDILPGNKKISLYPNPARDHVWVTFHGWDPCPCMVTFYDIHGRLIVKKEITNSRAPWQLDISLLKPGVYFIDVKGKGFRRTLKMIAGH